MSKLEWNSSTQIDSKAASGTPRKPRSSGSIYLRPQFKLEELKAANMQKGAVSSRPANVKQAKTYGDFFQLPKFAEYYGFPRTRSVENLFEKSVIETDFGRTFSSRQLKKLKTLLQLVLYTRPGQRQFCRRPTLASMVF